MVLLTKPICETIDSLINILQFAKEQGCSGNEMVVFRDYISGKTTELLSPILFLEEGFDPHAKEKLCRRIVIEGSMEYK